MRLERVSTNASMIWKLSMAFSMREDNLLPPVMTQQPLTALQNGMEKHGQQWVTASTSSLQASPMMRREIFTQQDSLMVTPAASLNIPQSRSGMGPSGRPLAQVKRTI